MYVHVNSEFPKFNYQPSLTFNQNNYGGLAFEKSDDI